ncbi:MAG: hypothetical protein NTU66_05440 [Elusimicrobia bacterium]|nr:hypothetical protein [Elusimicrobiota bacterium]
MSNKYSFHKLTAILTLGAFSFSSILAEPLLSVTSIVEDRAKEVSLSAKINQETLPLNLGRIVESASNGSDALVILVQDLHCHPQVQKNIAGILAYFEGQHHLSGIFAEGAPAGKVDTTLLTTLPDKKIQAQVLKDFLEKGLISGVEYYAVTAAPDKLYGLEQWDVYQSNLARIKKIFSEQADAPRVTLELSSRVRELKERYCSRKAKRIERFVDAYIADVPANYKRIYSLARKVNTDVKEYPNFYRYLQIAERKKAIREHQLNKELKSYLKDLRGIVPFAIFQQLTSKLRDTGSNDSYRSLVEVANIYTPELSVYYPQLANFFQVIQLNHRVNPINLVLEERDFKRDLLARYAASPLEREILFIDEMARRLNDYAALKMSPEEFKYFSRNKGPFKALLVKYFGYEDVKDAVALIDNDDLNQYFTTNLNRDTIFLNNLTRNIGALPLSTDPFRATRDENLLGRLDSFKTMYVAITGGFHADLAAQLDRAGISYVSIVPNVTQNYDETIYRKLLAGKLNIADIASSAFAPALLALGMEPGTLNAFLWKWYKDAVSGGFSPRSVYEDIKGWIDANHIMASVSVKEDEAAGTYVLEINGQEYPFARTNGAGYEPVAVPDGSAFDADADGDPSFAEAVFTLPVPPAPTIRKPVSGRNKSGLAAILKNVRTTLYLRGFWPLSLPKIDLSKGKILLFITALYLAFSMAVMPFTSNTAHAAALNPRTPSVQVYNDPLYGSPHSVSDITAVQISGNSPRSPARSATLAPAAPVMPGSAVAQAKAPGVRDPATALRGAGVYHEADSGIPSGYLNIYTDPADPDVHFLTSRDRMIYLMQIHGTVYQFAFYGTEGQMVRAAGIIGNDSDHNDTVGPANARIWNIDTDKRMGGRLYEGRGVLVPLADPGLIGNPDAILAAEDFFGQPGVTARVTGKTTIVYINGKEYVYVPGALSIDWITGEMDLTPTPADVFDPIAAPKVKLIEIQSSQVAGYTKVYYDQHRSNSGVWMSPDGKMMVRELDGHFYDVGNMGYDALMLDEIGMKGNDRDSDGRIDPPYAKAALLNNHIYHGCGKLVPVLEDITDPAVQYSEYAVEDIYAEPGIETRVVSYRLPGGTINVTQVKYHGVWYRYIPGEFNRPPAATAAATQSPAQQTAAAQPTAQAQLSAQPGGIAPAQQPQTPAQSGVIAPTQQPQQAVVQAPAQPGAVAPAAVNNGAWFNNIINYLQNKFAWVIGAALIVTAMIFGKLRNKKDVIGNIADAPEGPLPDYSPNEKYLRSEYQAAFDALEGEMPDLIMVMTDNNPAKAQWCREYFGSRQGALKEVPFEVVSAPGQDTGRTLMEVFNTLRQEKFEELAVRYPALRGKRPDQLSVVILNVDGLDLNTFSRSLPATARGKTITPLDLSLANGIRSTQKLREQGRGGMVVMNPGAAYVGPMTRTGDITLVGANVSYEQMLQQQLPLMINNGRVRKLYHKFNDTQIENALEKTALTGMYHLSNMKLKQMQTFTGNMILSFDTPAKYQQFMEFAEIVCAQVNATYRNKSPPQFDMFTHLLIPLVMNSNGENPTGFFIKLRDAFGDENDRDFYKDFYQDLFLLYRRLFPQHFKNIQMTAFVPSDAVYTPISDANHPSVSSTRDQLLSLQHASQEAAPAPPAITSKKLQIRNILIFSLTSMAVALVINGIALAVIPAGAALLMIKGRPSNKLRFSDAFVFSAALLSVTLAAAGVLQLALLVAGSTLVVLISTFLNGRRQQRSRAAALAFTPSAPSRVQHTENSESSTTAGVSTPLDKSRELIEEWGQLLLNIKASAQDYDSMLLKAKKVMQLTLLSKKSFGPNTRPTAMLYRRLAELALETERRIAVERQDTPLPKSELGALDPLRDQFVSVHLYAIEYLHALDFSANLETLSSYIYHKQNWMERSGLMPLNRLIHGMTRGISVSRRSLQEQTRRVAGIGNFIVGPDNPLYDHSVTAAEINEYVHSLISKNSRYNVGIFESWYNRKGLQRAISIVTGLQSLLVAVPVLLTGNVGMLAAYGGTAGFIVIGILIPLATGLGLKIYLHWHFIRKGSNNSFYEAHTQASSRLLTGSPALKTSLERAISRKGRLSEAQNIIVKKEEKGKTIFDVAQGCLDEWEDILQQSAGSALTENDLRRIRDNALEVMRVLPLTAASLQSPTIEQTVFVYNRFIELTEKTSVMILVLDETTKNEAGPEISSIKEIYEYAIEYFSILEQATNIAILSTYRIPKNAPWYILERLHVMDLVRILFFIGPGITVSKNRIFSSLARLTTLGNTIKPGLYANSTSSIAVGISRDIEAQRNSEYFEVGITDLWKVSKMLRKFQPIAVLIVPALEMVFFSMPLTWSVFVSFFVMGLGLSLVFHWVPILSNWLGIKYVPHKKLLAALSAVSPEGNVHSARDAILQKEYDELSSVMDPGKTMPDLVLVMTGSNNQQQGFMDYFEANMPASLSPVPCGFISTSGEGTGRPILDAFDFFASVRWEELRDRYPQLKGKDVSDLRIVVINVDGSDRDTLSQPLPLQVDGKELTPLDLALYNGVRAVQGLAQENRAGMVIQDPSTVYLGPLKRTGDITMIGSTVGYGQMLEQGSTLLLRDFNSGRVRKLFHAYDDAKIQNMLAKKTLRGLYQLDNKNVGQMQALTGDMIISFDEAAKFEKFMKFFTLVRKQVILPYRGQAPPDFDFILHLMIPYVMLYNKDDPMGMYAKLEETFAAFGDRNHFEEFYWDLFRLYEDLYAAIGNGIEINASIGTESVFTSIYCQPGRGQNALEEQLGRLSNVTDSGSARPRRFTQFGSPRDRGRGKPGGNNLIALQPSLSEEEEAFTRKKRDVNAIFLTVSQALPNSNISITAELEKIKDEGQLSRYISRVISGLDTYLRPRAKDPVIIDAIQRLGSIVTELTKTKIVPISGQGRALGSRGSENMSASRPRPDAPGLPASELNEQKRLVLEQLKELGVLRAREGGIPASLMRYSVETIKRRAAVLMAQGQPLNTSTIRTQETREQAKELARLEAAKSAGTYDESDFSHAVRSAGELLQKIQNPLVLPAIVKHEIAQGLSTEDQKWLTSRAPLLAERSAVFVMSGTDDTAIAQMRGCAVLGMNVIGVSLLEPDASREQLRGYAYDDGRGQWKNYMINVPVEGVDVGVKVWAEPRWNDSNPLVVLHLELLSEQEQMTPRAKDIARLMAVNSPDDPERKTYEQILRGRGALSVISEGRPEFKEWVTSFDLPHKDFSVAVVQMNGADSIFASPRAVDDGYTSDMELNKIVYSLNLYNGDVVTAKAMDRKTAERVGVPANLLEYFAGDVDRIKAGLVTADVSSFVSDSEGSSMKFYLLYPEWNGTVYECSSLSMADSPVAMAKRYIEEMWMPAQPLKIAVPAPERTGVSSRQAQAASRLAPVVKLHSLTDLGRIAARIKMETPDVNTILLEPFSLRITAEDHLYGTISGYCVDPGLVDWNTEIARLGLAGNARADLSRVLESAEPSQNIGEMAQELNRFYVALQCYQALMKNVQFKNEFEQFVNNPEYGRESVNAARYLMAYRIMGMPPASAQEITGIANDPRNQQKWQLYVSVFAYMFFVARNQLRAEVAAAHQKNINVLFDYSVLTARNSADVVYHESFFSENNDKILISPVVDGKMRGEFVLNNGRLDPENGYAPTSAALQYWMREFGFDGVKISGISAYESVRDAYNSPTVFFARLAGAARGVKHDAILVVEPFMDQRHGHNSSGLVDAYTLIDVTDRNQLNRQRMSDEIGRRGKIWLRVLPSNKHVSDAYVDMCKQAREASLSDYVSFPLEQEEGEYTDIIGFLRSIIGDAVMGSEPVNEKGYFDQGYAQCGALRIPASALTALQTRPVEEFTLRSQIGTDTLMDLRVPGLAVLGVAYQFLKSAGDPGKRSLVHHSRNDDFFIKAFDVLARAGVTEKTAPEIWAYLNSLHSRALASPDDEMKVNRTIELFGFMQALQEAVSYAAYVSRGGTERSVDKKVFKKLLAAADSFIAQKVDGATEIVAGYPWFAESRSRDIFTSMSGILLATGRSAEAREMFEFFAAHQQGDGLMPNRILADGKAEYNTADGSLWYIEALEQYYQRTGDKEFIIKMQPVVNRIIECYARPQGDIRLDTDGLVVTPAQWTWMTAAPQGITFTPRNGKAVEIQALFYNALAIVADINRLAHDQAQAAQCEELKARVGQAVNTRFFEEGRDYPADVVDGDSRGNAIRPNAVFLLSLSKVDDLLRQERKEAILKTLEEELLTPYGVRTLSPRDEQYTGMYDTFLPQEIQDRAYHQGTAWPFLIAHYARAKAKVRSQDKNTKREILSSINNLVHILIANNTLPELFSGDEPQTPGGAVSQAWSVAALLEVYDLLKDSSKHFALVTDRDFDDATNPEIYKHLFGAG